MTPERTTHELLELLRASGLLDDEVVDVTPLHQRSECLLVRLGDGRALFAKRARQSASGAWSADVVAEGEAMQRLSRLPAVRPLMPAVLAVHPEHRLLVTEGFAAGVPLDRARLLRGGSDPERAAALGAALAAIHRSAPDGMGVVDHAGPMQRNWSRLTPRSVTLFPAGYREIAVRVQAGDYLDQLGELATGWRADTLVHGDVKSDNVLCHPDDAAPLRLIDWECTGRGDARWDVGSAVGDYLAGWLRTMHVTPDRGLAGWIESATPSLPRLREELAALLAAYRAGQPGVGDDDVAGWMRYAGMFLLHRLTVAAMQSVEVASHSLAVLQVSRQLVRSPHTAMEVLLP